MTEHSPTPWRIVQFHNSPAIVDAGNSTVAKMIIAANLAREPNAALIVRAVNLHQQLVDALEAFESWFDDEQGNLPELAEQIFAALAVARQP